MNKLETTGLGGLPIALDDIRFLYESIKEAFTGVANAFSLTNVVGGNPAAVKLWGCTITTDLVTVAPNVKYSVAAGFIAMGGEVFYVPQATVIAGAADSLYFVISESFDADGQITFADQSVQNIYKIRTATIATSTAGSAYYSATVDTLDIRSMIRKNVRPVWDNIDAISGVGGHAAIGYDGLNYYIKFDLTFTSGFDVTSDYLMQWYTEGFGIYESQASLFVGRSLPIVVERNNLTPLSAILRIGITQSSTPVYFMHIYNTAGALWPTSFADSGYIRGVYQITYNS